MSKRKTSAAAGFTLLEVLVVVAILGLLAAMVWPLAGALNDSRREQITNQRLAEIRQALLGHDQLVDGMNRERVIGGYVNDFGAWPDLYEPGAVVAGERGVGDRRGSFSGRRFAWHRPWLVVSGAAGEGESLGQPLGLWTRQLGDYTGVSSDNLDSERWQGPYLIPPTAARPDAGSHFAANQNEYEILSSDDREWFHLLQGDHQLLDGWGRAFRFFIHADPDDGEGGKIFMVVSLGANGRAEFPADIANYDSEASANRDNLVLQLKESDWRTIYRQQHLRSRSQQQLLIFTEDLLQRLARAIIGTAPAGANTGYTGDLMAWPWLYNWVCRDAEAQMVACDDATAVAASGAWEHSWVEGGTASVFTYGQPRDLWGQAGQEDNRFGVGWRHSYHPPPPGAGSAELLQDAWERSFHLFLAREQKDGDGEGACTGPEQLLLLSAGPGGSFHFPPNLTGSTYQACDGPAALAERTAFCLADYDPAHPCNQDNLSRLLRRNEWRPGYFTLETLEVENVPAAPHDHLKCRLFGVLDSADERDDPLLVAGPDGTYDDGTGAWVVGDENNPAFDFADNPHHLISGGRYLVCWADDNDDDVPDPGEPGWRKIFPVAAHAAQKTAVEKLTLDFTNFAPLP